MKMRRLLITVSLLMGSIMMFSQGGSPLKELQNTPGVSVKFITKSMLDMASETTEVGATEMKQLKKKMRQIEIYTNADKKGKPHLDGDSLKAMAIEYLDDEDYMMIFQHTDDDDDLTFYAGGNNAKENEFNDIVMIKNSITTDTDDSSDEDTDDGKKDKKKDTKAKAKKSKKQTDLCTVTRLVGKFSTDDIMKVAGRKK